MKEYTKDKQKAYLKAKKDWDDHVAASQGQPWKGANKEKYHSLLTTLRGALRDLPDEELNELIDDGVVPPHDRGRRF